MAAGDEELWRLTAVEAVRLRLGTVAPLSQCVAVCAKAAFWTLLGRMLSVAPWAKLREDTMQ